MGRKLLGSRLEEKLSSQPEKEKRLHAQFIDKLLERKRVQAEAYASEPSIFTLFSLELEMKSTHGNRLIIYTEGQWSCTCPFFKDWGRCSHTMATELLLKDSLLPAEIKP